MDRQVALILSFLSLILFLLLTYYGARVSFWSSFIFGLFVALILLNVFYPPSQVTTDDADISLGVYAAYVIAGIILLAIYVTQKTLSDVRTVC